MYDYTNYVNNDKQQLGIEKENEKIIREFIII